MKTLFLSIGIKVAKATLESVCSDIVLTGRGPDEVQARAHLSGLLPDRNAPEGWRLCEITAVAVDVVQQVYGPGEGAGPADRSSAMRLAKPFNPRALLAGSVLLALPALVAIPAMVLAGRRRAAELPGGPGRNTASALKTRIQGLLPPARGAGPVNPIP
ncbi:MAG: hypothetical protein JO069_20115 [Verrucomicrobia bacterium]|nr:hypothetical protein [Verrucomicrobiota bacterium]